MSTSTTFSVNSGKTSPQEEFLVRLRSRFGIVSLACSDLNIPEETVHQWMQEDHRFAKAVVHARERMLDFVEAKMFEKIGTGNERLIRFFLETQGKDRGYVKRQELAVPLCERLELSPEESLMLEGKEDDRDE
ncbi:MAG: hypothetical protein Q4G68_06630 [Planctomycetia bacterium]|nr:hypothetical protein [Planctomycetia bacterium]